MTLDSGFSIELTPEHEVAVIHGNAIALKKAKDLTPEDVLLMKLGDETSGTDGKREELQVVAYEKSKYTSFQLKKITQPALLDEDLAYFLGWFFADGHVSRQGIGLAIADTNREEQRVKKLAQDLFGLTPCVQKSGADKCRKVDINSLVLQKYLRVNGLLKQHAWNIEVPEKILRSPGSVQMAFIAGFFDGDGDNGKNYRLNSTSKKFVQQLQLMLLANGVGAKIKAEQGKEARWRLLYRVGIIGKDSTRQFYALTSGRSWKIKKKEGGKDFGWIFPFHPIRDLGYSWSDIKQLHDGVRSTVSCSVLSHIQQRAFLRQAETATRERIDWTGFLPVRLQSVEKAGRQEVYDFEVEDIHMINAGLYTSNSRHGANMAMMRVDHPDVLDFIRCKNKEGDIRNFNVTVTITDEFMNAVEKRPHEQWYCTFKGEKYKPRKVLRHATRAVYGSEDIDITAKELFDQLVESAWLNGEPGIAWAVYGSEDIDITAKELFDQLVESAWLNGEPGIAFLGTINATNPLPGLGPIAASNPCGEQFLHSYDNCNLGSLNLALFVKKGAVDWPRLKFVVKTAVRMLDNVIDLFDFPVAQVTDLARKNRRIGLGIMGFADMLYQLGIGYDSKKGYAVAEKVMEYIQREAHAMSRELAKEKGVFPNFAMSVHAKKKTNMRNAALTTVAPTGSISMMFDVSSGLEPNFALAFVKQDKDGNQYRYFNRYFENALKKMKLSQKDQDGIMNEVIEKGTVRHISALPKALRDTFVVSMDISGESHVRMQAAFQRHVDNSISKTINFPNSATQEEVGESFMLAWKLGCKSCTVYRDGSRNVQVLNIGTGERVVSTTEVPGAPVAAKKEELPIDRQRLAP
ncbi:MAG: adenosylcobalamin-dependent ribonucleoside-diphosphate reductase, partial [Candidatus Wildermuthbacteria bacterium]|nr:adenosylcobalamin-dependent ribonucleoside-diphosphate reductase [Candidatus Wildermuthbacteria bacterium]